jgi:hypothetical protein
LNLIKHPKNTTLKSRQTGGSLCRVVPGQERANQYIQSGWDESDFTKRR